MRGDQRRVGRSCSGGELEGTVLLLRAGKREDAKGRELRDEGQAERALLSGGNERVLGVEVWRELPVVG